MKKTKRIKAVILTAILTVVSVIACQVPVFRYALERWNPDKYMMTVSSPTELTEDEKAVITTIITNHANINFKRVKGEEKSITISSPYQPDNKGVVFKGPIKKESLSLLQSPLRKKLIKNILSGKSSTILLLECSDKAKNEEAKKKVLKAIETAKKTLKVPDGIVGKNAKNKDEVEDPDNVLRSEIELKIDFELIVVKRTAEEDVLVKSLLHAEEDLMDLDEPMAFMCFGRGRSLYPAIGKGITEEYISTKLGVLCRACTCSSKQEIAGFDLFLAVNWKEAVDTSSTEDDRTLFDLGGVEELKKQPPGKKENEVTKVEQTEEKLQEVTKPEEKNFMMKYIYTGIIILISVIALSFVRK